MGGGVPFACAGARRFRENLRQRDGRAQTRHVGLRHAALAARIPGANLAISQSPRLRLADHDRKGAALLGKIEQVHGVDRYLVLAIWGVESAYGDPMVQQKYMRPVFPAFAALAWGEPRRRAYWE